MASAGPSRPQSALPHRDCLCCPQVHCCETTWDPNLNTTLYVVQMTELRKDPIYINVYITGMYLVFIYMLPFSALAVLNAAIYRQVRQARLAASRGARPVGLITMRPWSNIRSPLNSSKFRLCAMNYVG